METELKARQIKVRCPQHQTVFEITESREIICEIREHPLSQNFPHGEFWEYCCDCRMFSPSLFGAGGRAAEYCLNCERKISLRFVCEECKVVAYDSGQETKGKIYSISDVRGVAPNCPGCRKSFVSKIHPHDCSEIEAVLLTARAECPFCVKTILLDDRPELSRKVEQLPAASVAPPVFESHPHSTPCLNCGQLGKMGRTRCENCGFLISGLPGAPQDADSDPETLVAGRICPNCGTPSPRDMIFCTSCGHMFSAPNPLLGQPGVFQPSTPPPPLIIPTYPQNVSPFGNPQLPLKAPPPPIPGSGNYQSGQTIAFQPNPSAYPVSQTAPRTGKAGKSLLIGGVLVTAVFFVIIILVASKPPTVANKSNAAVNNSTVPANSNPYASMIGKTGRTTTDIVIRSDAGPNYMRVGLAYMNSKIRVLNAKNGDTGTLWYRVRVIEYGCSKDPNNGCGKEIASESDEGWVYGGNVSLD